MLNASAITETLLEIKPASNLIPNKIILKTIPPMLPKVIYLALTVLSSVFLWFLIKSLISKEVKKIHPYFLIPPKLPFKMFVSIVKLRFSLTLWRLNANATRRLISSL